MAAVHGDLRDTAAGRLPGLRRARLLRERRRGLPHRPRGRSRCVPDRCRHPARHRRCIIAATLRQLWRTARRRHRRPAGGRGPSGTLRESWRVGQSTLRLRATGQPGRSPDAGQPTGGRCDDLRHRTERFPGRISRRHQPEGGGRAGVPARRRHRSAPKADHVGHTRCRPGHSRSEPRVRPGRARGSSSRCSSTWTGRLWSATWG